MSTGGNYISPAWSPDGNFIAVATYHDDNHEYDYDLLVMRPDGSDIRQLTSNDGDEYYPSWSPEGGRIAYLGNPVSSGSEFDESVFVVDLAALSAFTPTEQPVPRALNLTSNSVADWDPVWSPDGDRIAFVRNLANEDDTEIYVMNSDGGGEQRLTNNLVHDFDPVWAPDSRRIFFVREGGSRDYELYVINADGSGERRIPFDQDDVHNLSWSLSPDGRRIVYAARSSADPGWTKLFVMKADGSGTQRLIVSHGEDYPYTANYGSPIWSPDGDQIAFIIDNHFSAEWLDIYVINADGSDVRRVAETGHNGFIAWSSSDRIAFTRLEVIDGRRVESIYSMRPDGSDLQHVIASPQWGMLIPNFRTCDRYDFQFCREGLRGFSSPTWSPDGSRLAFLESVGDAINARGNGIRHVFLSNADGSDLQQLTATFEYDSDIVWSPDGSRILFVSRRGTWQEKRGDLEIYVINV